MTTPSAVQKICSLCGQDVSTQKRTKDTQGNYYCAACWTIKVSQAQHESIRKAPPPPPPQAAASANPNGPVSVPAPAVSHVPVPASAAPIAYGGPNTMQTQVGVSPHRHATARTANLAAIINFLLAVIVPVAWFIFYSDVATETFYYRLGTIFAFYLFGAFVIWGIGCAIPGGKMTSVVLALIFSILAALLCLAILAFAVVALVAGAELLLILPTLTLSLVLLAIYGKLGYHAICTLMHGAR